MRKNRLSVDIYYSNNHRIIEHDDHDEIKCPIRQNVFRVYSESGDINLCCPGCGEKLYEENQQ